MAREGMAMLLSRRQPFNARSVLALEQTNSSPQLESVFPPPTNLNGQSPESHPPVPRSSLRVPVVYPWFS
jgi:hypothetical protein